MHPPHHTVFTRIITKCRTDLKKSFSRTLTNEGIKQNDIIAELSITAIIIYSRLSAVPQAADQVRYTIHLLFRPKGDDTRDPISFYEHIYRCQPPTPYIISVGDKLPDTTLSPSRAKQLSRRNKPEAITNII